MYGKSTPELLVVQAVGPEDLNTAVNAGTWCELTNYRSAEVHIFIGDLAGGTAVVTMLQATELAGTGSKALTFTKYYRTGQRLNMNTVVGNFVAAETVTGGTSGNTAVVIKPSSDHLYVTTASGTTTWTDGETLTGGTSGATALAVGTGQNEDLLLEPAAVSSTFTTTAIVFQHYMIPIDQTMLDMDNGFDVFSVYIAQAGVGPTEGCAFYILKDPVIRSYPQQSAIGAVKLV